MLILFVLLFIFMFGAVLPPSSMWHMGSICNFNLLIRFRTKDMRRCLAEIALFLTSFNESYEQNDTRTEQEPETGTVRYVLPGGRIRSGRVGRIFL